MPLVVTLLSLLSFVIAVYWETADQNLALSFLFVVVYLKLSLNNNVIIFKVYFINFLKTN